MKVTNNVDFKSAKLKMRAAIGVYADTAAKKMEGEAKKNAKWTDRTGNAKNSIQGDFGWERNNALITLSGNVDYFKWLELTKEKKHAILVPTIQSNSSAILRGYKRLVK